MKCFGGSVRCVCGTGSWSVVPQHDVLQHKVIVAKLRVAPWLSTEIDQ